ncbi:4-hydroxy-3-methylbut-2-enyl diphosphate reductase [Neoehrlichia mikurensis]|uniref:4-hydroxy-3-methylbut-2-enyl diphosphate reductase n=1 Tax=Neoehrlichia mikurensis TaxID=89586 RepID=UPI001C46D2AC|nr:4-hydroxy-3-methylbut-2-enyl diphosphate reductase [Neoehrlichia mikurensis]QXK91868.1 4-hydroxy-3-methylbut-2-enyl diphosphate reductase [Neoehrlichia mikurensis]QXK93081.1 4-hydroxy-3-methylbut-2-enyl diphosphate reductase [Neoehrlichia mikurensis]QXK93561.1 4-hydroxy-3-methylbut-2-enyl diphosphate reductase [Neoehrlichia mikurensis]
MNNKKNLEIILAQPMGFCAGVRRAIEIVELIIHHYKNKKKIYVLHEIVHNSFIVSNFKQQGVIFINKVEQASPDSILIFSAHGVSKQITEETQKRKIHVIDATCPLVTKVHLEVQKYDKEGYKIILIGHKGHREVEGTRGQINNPVTIVQNVQDVHNIQIKNNDKIAYVTQTTLSIDDTKHIIETLKQKFPDIKGQDLKDICYATQNRQNSVKYLSCNVDLMLIIGSNNSSNSNRLLDLAKSYNVKSFLIDSYNNININWFQQVNKVGITAGASAPDILIKQVINYLKLNFKLPKNIHFTAYS